MKRWRDNKNWYRKKTTCFKKSKKKSKTWAKSLRKSSKLIVKALRISYRRCNWKKKCSLTKFKSLTLKRFNFSTKSDPFKPITSPYKQKLINWLMNLWHLKRKSGSSMNNSPKIHNKTTKMQKKSMSKANHKVWALKTVHKKSNPQKESLKSNKTHSKSKSPLRHLNWSTNKSSAIYFYPSMTSPNNGLSAATFAAKFT